MFFKKLEKWPAQSQIYAKRSKFEKKTIFCRKSKLLAKQNRNLKQMKFEKGLKFKRLRIIFFPKYSLLEIFVKKNHKFYSDNRFFRKKNRNF